MRLNEADDDPKRPMSHLDAHGRARMVDVSGKDDSERRATARALVTVGGALQRRLVAGDLPKGDAFATARIAGIQAAKETARLIPLCHPIAIASVQVELAAHGDRAIEIIARVGCRGPTGVEMEALTAASVAALTLYDMCKSIERGITIGPIELVEKSGGRSGTWRRDDDAGGVAGGS